MQLDHLFKSTATRSLSIKGARLAGLIKQSEGEKRGRVSSARGKMTSFFAVRSLLLLSQGPLASWGGLPSFLVTMEEEWHYHKCDPAMCWWTTFDIEIDTDYRSVLWEKFWEISKLCFQRSELKSRDSRLRLGLVGGVSNH